MVDWAVNIVGNAAAKAREDALAIDTLTAALKAEEAALKRSYVAQQRSKAAGVIDVKSFQAVQAGKANVEALKKSLDAVGGPQKLGLFDALAKSGGPLGGLVKNIRSVKESLAGNPAAALAVGATVASVAVVGLGVSLLSAAKDAATFAATAADGARSARLLNDAADIAGGGSIQLTAVVNQLAMRVPVAKDKLAEMGRELRRSRFTGREAQVVLSAYATAASALGDGGGAAVKNIAETSKAMRRFTLGARDAYGEYTALKGTGLTKGDLFAALAVQLKTDVSGVRQRFQEGRITVRQGLEGVDAALQKKFGKTISAQLLSIGTQFDKMKEDFVGLFSGSDIEPFLKSLKGVTSIFSQDTASGRAFKEVVTRILDDLGKLATKIAPDLRAFILDLGTQAAQPGGFADAIQGWIKDAKAFSVSLREIVDAIKFIASAASFTTKLAKGAVTGGAAGAVETQADIDARLDRVAKGTGSAKDFTDSGRQMVLGIKAGIDGAAPEAVNSITSLAAKLQSSFKAANDIRSPAGKFKEPGRNIPRGVAFGVRDTTPEAERSVRDMSAGMQATMSAAPKPPEFTMPAALSSAVPSNTLNIGSIQVIGSEALRDMVTAEVRRTWRQMVSQGPSRAA